MGIDLVLQHLKPHRVQLLLHLMLFSQRLDIALCGLLHGTERPDQAGNLILSLCLDIRPSKIIFTNAP